MQKEATPKSTFDQPTGAASPAVRADVTSAVRRTALEGLGLGLSMVIVHAVGEPRFEMDAAGRWVRPIDRKTGMPAVYRAKTPCGVWRERQEKPATRNELARYLHDRRYGESRGVAVVCGYGGVELFEFDDVGVWKQFLQVAERDPVVGPILRRVMAGYFELSPRGAPHLLYRCANLSNGGPLARRPEIVFGEDGTKKLKVQIETRGPGQLAVIAPTPGTCHKTGRPYVLKFGGLAGMVTLTPDERTALHSLARTFDEAGEDPSESLPRPNSPPHRPSVSGASEKPGHHFNRVCTAEMWSGMLADWRWQYIGAIGGRPHCWVHATATSSLSAHLTPRNTLLVFSTSTPFQAWTKEHPTTHSAFAVFTKICHRGNFEAAAKALAACGYGSRRAWAGGRRGSRL